MTPSDENLPPADSALRKPEPGRPPESLPDSSYNPFRLIVPRTSRWRKLGDYLALGGHIGAVIFWLVGMLISLYLLIITPDRTWVDWLLRPIFFPGFLAMLGEVVGVVGGLIAWFGYLIFHVQE